MWNVFPIGLFKPPTLLRYRQIQWLASFVASSFKDGQGVLGKLAGGADKPEAVRAFGDEDVEYLAPLLVEGLTRAASDQQVGFRVIHIATPTPSQVGGLIFCLSDVRFPGVCKSEQTQKGESRGNNGRVALRLWTVAVSVLDRVSPPDGSGRIE